MGAVLINTHRNSKLAYLYTVATFLFISPLFMVMCRVLDKWWYYCKNFPSENPKCPANPEEFNKNMLEAAELCYVVSYCFYHIGHFLFAYRYFEVAEMFGREDKT